MPGPIRAALARCARWPGPALRLRIGRLESHVWSFANVADLAFFGVRVSRRGGFAPVVLVEHGSAAAVVGWRFAARLDEIGRVLDHGGEISLRGAAEIPVFPVLQVLAVIGRAEILRPQAARAGIGGDARVAELERRKLLRIARPM